MTAIQPPRDPFDFPPVTGKVTYKGVDYHFRELTVGETDECRDAAIDEKADTFDGRLMTRMMIEKSAYDPTMDLEQIAKLPQSLFAAIVEEVNELNDPDALKEDKEPGNS